MTKKFTLKDYVDETSIGMALIDENHVVLDVNHTFETLVRRVEPFFTNSLFTDAEKNGLDGSVSFVGRDFYRVLGLPRFETQCYAPCYFAKKEGRTTRALLSWGGSENATNGKAPIVYYELSVTYVAKNGTNDSFYLAELRDATTIAMKARKTRQLEDLSRELILAVANNRMKTVEEKKELLKNYVGEALRDVFNYDVFEIRIVDASDKERALKYFVGWNNDSEDASHLIKPRWNENGITGCVAISREYYICDDTRNDAHYVKGAFDARSSMTVPLIVRDMLIGVCNVESEKPNAFTTEDAEFLTSYSRAVALALYFLNFLSSEFTNLLYDCGKEIDDRLRAATSSLLERSLELANVFFQHSQGEADHWEKTEFIDSLIADSLELSSSIAGLKRSICNYEQRANDFENAAVYKFLAKSRILVVGAAPWNYVGMLEELGACVDVVRTTSAALIALERCPYDLVVSERTPDGKFFQPMQKSDPKGALNSRRLNVYDIHEDGYFEPAADDPFDAAERKRVRGELEAGKRDAFFLFREMRKTERNKRTLFLLAIDHEYDPTHIQNCLSKAIGNKMQPAFYSDTEILTPVLKAIQRALDYRAAFEVGSK